MSLCPVSLCPAIRPDERKRLPRRGRPTTTEKRVCDSSHAQLARKGPSTYSAAKGEPTHNPQFIPPPFLPHPWAAPGIRGVLPDGYSFYVPAILCHLFRAFRAFRSCLLRIFPPSPHPRPPPNPRFNPSQFPSPYVGRPWHPWGPSCYRPPRLPPPERGWTPSAGLVYRAPSP
jgi:hypothetical protein